MNGTIFIAFNEMIESKYGLPAWEALLVKVCPVSGGSYTSVEDFPDSELVALVVEFAEMEGRPVQEMLVLFGEYLFTVFSGRYPAFVEQKPDLVDFLKSVEDTIHLEVKKLYDHPSLPKIWWEHPDDVFLLHYQSPRKLCALAEGLVRGAAARYGNSVSLSQSKCMLHGDDHCTIQVHIS